MAFDETGQAATLQDKVSMYQRSNVLTIDTGLPEHNDYGVDFPRPQALPT